MYRTFKDTVYLPALLETNQPLPRGVERQILQTQGPTGAFHTGYDQNGTYAGTLENAETTSMVILALEAYMTGSPSFSPS